MPEHALTMPACFHGDIGAHSWRARRALAPCTQAGDAFVAMYGCADSSSLPEGDSSDVGEAPGALGGKLLVRGEVAKRRRCEYPYNEVWLRAAGQGGAVPA